MFDGFCKEQLQRVLDSFGKGKILRIVDRVDAKIEVYYKRAQML